jgi:hypothetical protein
MNSETFEAAALRLPPYGRKLLDLRSNGQAPMTAALVVDGWAPCENVDEYEPWVVVVPDDEPAETFDFRFLTGLFVVVYSATVGRVLEIAEQVYRFWPRTVFLYAEEARRMAVLREREQ